ncbi:hypothetical protein HGRIS_007890 [Hohenbuehelia grisea]|uniref:GH16 domain-containing protein n=1 Tax=Hohenbuehelia grisea TaxID=104357 RepID=A0ABR3J6L9_9AGAR
MYRGCLLYASSLLILGAFYPRALSESTDGRFPSVAPPLSRQKRSNLDKNPDGTTFVWLLQDSYEGKTFYDTFEFFNYSDPTNGAVTYVDRDHAFDKKLVYITDDNKVIMKSDNTSWLAHGQFRESVRIQGRKHYHTGLFILDLDKAPWGCGVWPAFWTIGEGQWPHAGEIDIFEGVHDNQHNQVTWHTSPGCHLTPNATFTGSPVIMSGKQHTDCNGLLPGNPGCGIVEWSRASYGPLFDAQGGGVYAMKWDENGISVWSFFRAAVPQDIFDGSPNPSTWGPPVAFLHPARCDPLKFFVNHSIIFDITFCGRFNELKIRLFEVLSYE